MSLDFFLKTIDQQLKYVNFLKDPPELQIFRRMKTHDTYKGEDHVFGYASLVLVLSTVLAKIFVSLNSF